MAGGGQLFYIFVSHREESARDSHGCDGYIMAVLFWVPAPVVEWTSFHFEYSSVDALESVVSLGPMLLGILDTKYPAPFGIMGCLTTTFPFRVSARNKLYQ